MKRNGMIWSILGVALIAGVIIWAVSSGDNDKNLKSATNTTQDADTSQDKNTSQATQPNNSSQSSDSTQQTKESKTITYTSSGFNPNNLTVTAGTEITVKNDSGTVLDFASGPHPVHTENSELNIGEVANGTSKAFTANAKGTWSFHNHEKDDDSGTLIVN